ncbi:MAG: hypothetical protein VXW00_01765, partial [Candidatus Latescibacterota bacterium]|nr:hypothetical protein [Candidatus Latescibacterota bacterium]
GRHAHATDGAGGVRARRRRRFLGLEHERPPHHGRRAGRAAACFLYDEQEPVEEGNLTQLFSEK